MFRKAIDGIEFKEIPIERVVSNVEDNPRLGVNEAKDELKNSIGESQGRHVILEVSQRPGSSEYCLFRGGNTRLEVLVELCNEWDSNEANPYRDVKCMVFPWNEYDKTVLSATENLVRGELCYAEQAKAIRMLKERYDRFGSDIDVSFDDWVKRIGVSMKAAHGATTRYLYTDMYITPFMPKLMIDGKAKLSVAIYLLNVRSSVYKIIQDRRIKEVGIELAEMSRREADHTRDGVKETTNTIMQYAYSECDNVLLNKGDLNKAVVRIVEEQTGFCTDCEKRMFIPDENVLLDQFADRYKLSDSKEFGDDKRKNAALLIHDAISKECKLSANRRTRVMNKLEVSNDVSGFIQLAAHLDSTGRDMLARMVKEA